MALYDLAHDRVTGAAVLNLFGLRPSVGRPSGLRAADVQYQVRRVYRTLPEGTAVSRMPLWSM